MARKMNPRCFFFSYRFGSTLPTVDNMLKVDPFETASRHLRTVSDWAGYKKVHSTLPAVASAAFRTRVKSGDIKAIREIWDGKDKIFLAIDFEWSERNASSVLEWGYAAVRCGHLSASVHGCCGGVTVLSDLLLGLDIGLQCPIRIIGPCFCRI
jgi:hypothetical protein